MEDNKLKVGLLIAGVVVAVALVAWQGFNFASGPQEEVVGSLGDLSGDRGPTAADQAAMQAQQGNQAATPVVDPSGAPPGALLEGEGGGRPGS